MLKIILLKRTPEWAFLAWANFSNKQKLWTIAACFTMNEDFLMAFLSRSSITGKQNSISMISLLKSSVISYWSYITANDRSVDSR
jgi:hypothetical protein